MNNHNILLVGNANTGKTTLFNNLTKSNEKTGNWHGVTNKESYAFYYFENQRYNIVDLPGIYSLSALSFEEEVATNFVLANTDKLCLNICEQDNITRNLYLTMQLLELGIHTILVVNTKAKKCKLDLEMLSKKLGIPVCEYKNKKSIIEIKKQIANYKENKIIKFEYINKIINNNKIVLNNKKTNKKIINNNIDDCNTNCDSCNKCSKKSSKKNNLFKNKFDFNFVIDFNLINDNFIILKLLEKDELFCEYFEQGENKQQEIAVERYKCIDMILQKQNVSKEVYGKSKLDIVLLNKFFALPIFFCILIGIFYLTFFSIGQMLSDFLSSQILHTGKVVINFLSSFFGNGWFLDMIDGAIFGGIGSVLSFLPQVCLLFLFLSILEDSGYLSRVAFLFEDIFCKIGLSGKGVYTLLMGFGCSATSIMTARNMEDKNAKIKVALITPYFSCSAKLPIYAVVGGAFFGAGNVFVIFALYLLGVIVALLLCAILNKTIYKSKEQSFILEFAPLKFVSAKRVLKIVWDNIKSFLIRIGSLLICINVIVWVVSSFSFSFRYVAILGGESMLESVGRFLAPVFAPLGFGSWGPVSALLAGLVAKEIVISSIAIFNGVSTDSSLLSQSLYNPYSAVFFSPASALSFLVFCLLYTPCVSTIAVIKKEFGGKFAFGSIFSQVLIAYVLSFAVFSILSYSVINLICLAVGILLVIGVAFAFKKKNQKLKFKST